MLPLRPFKLIEPATLTELGRCLKDANQKTKIMAGGTDLLPNLKHGLYDIDRIISLRGLLELQKITRKGETLSIGAGVKLNELIEDPMILNLAPALSIAASHIASPQIRNMATVGGNICLDTRCLYFNQSEVWRSALGYCLKKDGTACHVVKSGKRCVAASSNDLATMLLAFNARLNIWSNEGEKVIELDNFYSANGLKNNKLEPHEILTSVELELKPNAYAAFAKLRHRESIDFSLLSIGLVFFLEGIIVTDIRLAVNAMVAKPKVFNFSELIGRVYDQHLIEEIADQASNKCHPQTNICDDPEWRKAMIKCYVKRAFKGAKNIE
jgi:4-hydroxybenzoyl-CoA reductase subunit beta